MGCLSMCLYINSIFFHILYGTSSSTGNESLYKWPRSHDLDVFPAHILTKPLAIFFISRSPMILKRYEPSGTQGIQNLYKRRHRVYLDILKGKVNFDQPKRLYWKKTLENVIKLEKVLRMIIVTKGLCIYIFFSDGL